MRSNKPWILHNRICWTVLLAFTFLAMLPVNSSASLAESRLSNGETISLRAGQIEKIRQALEQEVVAQRLADYGLTPEEVSAKLPTMSDEQLHQLAGLSDTLAEGGILGLVIGVLLVILLVVVILKVADKQIIIR
ncbi:MAG: PA2779 family protein [Syntrophotaleaceae bacterium]